MDDPNRAAEKTENADEHRPKLRSESELPKCTRSSTEHENTDPKRVSARTLTPLPQCT
jgi:hypothetical protein